VKEWTIIGVPINSSGRATGVERMPAALRAADLVQQVSARDAGDLHLIIDDPRRDPVTGLIGFQTVCTASTTIRQAVSNLLACGQRPLVLGGDCTLLIGVWAALKDQFGRVGLAFVDGHLDFYDGHSSPTGETSDMELAILTGFGPTGLTDLSGPPPLIFPHDVTVLGYRDREQAAEYGAPDPMVLAPAMRLYDAQIVRSYGPSRLGRDIAALFINKPGRFWLHLDLDVLDQAVMPAVDYLMPGGLDWDELAELLRPLTTSPVLIGMDVTILNPTLDPDGEYAERTVSLLGKMLAA
jgi:arginase